MQAAEAAEDAEQHLRRQRRVVRQRQRRAEDKAQRRQPQRLLLDKLSRRDSRPDGRAAEVEDAEGAEDAEAVISRRRLRAHHSHSRPVSIAVNSQAANRWP